MMKLIKQFDILHFIQLLLVCGFVSINFVNAQTTSVELPKEKQTTLGLYVTAKEAYEKWKTNPDQVKILDVRTPEEFLFVGHAPMAWNVPAFIQVYQYDEAKKKFPMKPNEDFVSQIIKLAKTEDVILVTCRSGGRSAMAVNQLAAAGFKNVYNIIDGMEGDLVDDPQSIYAGQHMRNGWKNSGLPWTYEVVPEKMVIPASK